jgi:hypothetical protein
MKIGELNKEKKRALAKVRLENDIKKCEKLEIEVKKVI